MDVSARGGRHDSHPIRSYARKPISGLVARIDAVALKLERGHARGELSQDADFPVSPVDLVAGRKQGAAPGTSAGHFSQPSLGD